MSNDSTECSELFECKKCGDCCRGYGGTYLTEQDIQRIAEYIHMDPETFISKYCSFSGETPVIAQKNGGYCVFWDELCSIHPVKPRMCKQWPFIESVLVDIKNWQIMAGMCPGIRTEVDDEKVKKCIKCSISNTCNK
jgi:Fe-S-cluster containining protein